MYSTCHILKMAAGSIKGPSLVWQEETVHRSVSPFCCVSGGSGCAVALSLSHPRFDPGMAETQSIQSSIFGAQDMYFWMDKQGITSIRSQLSNTRNSFRVPPINEVNDSTRE